MKTKYMHTLNGMPAVFDDGQICYMPRGNGNRRPMAALVDDMATIRAHRRASTAFRKSLGYSVDDGEYGVIKIAV